MAPVSKGRVRRSIRIVALQSEVSIRRVLTGKINEVSSSGDDLAIGLQGQSEGIASLTRKTRCHNAAIAKGSVERSIRVVTDQFEVAEKGKERKSAACDQDFTIGLDKNRRSHSGQPGKICPHFAIHAKGGVKRAVSVVARDGEVLASVIIVFIGLPDDHQFAIRLQCHRIGDVG